MADPTTTVAPDTAAGPKTMDAGKWANKRIYLRLLIYTAGGHLFAGFIILLFELGSRNK
ncbi:DUF6126 family protein [Kitasatospora sp. NPDC101235]|uniref:DUF6126 family protein n=1 Tax=Kitasatospora sp. NPDC101235 TaxID=3364101 RepID=UPI0038140987